MLTVDALRDWGANVDEGLGRCFGKEDFYLNLVNMLLADGSFARLDAAVAAGDAKAAFEAAHNLKGSTGNLALTPVYVPVCAITEALRGQSDMKDVSAPHAEINAALASLRRLAQ